MKKILYILLIMFVVTPQMMEAYETNKQERNLIRDGNKAYKEGNYAKALDYYEKALMAAPGSEYARFDKAVALSKLSANPEDSIYQESVKTYTDLAQFASDTKIKEKSNYNLGNLAFEQENYPESIEFYKETLRINPNNLKARENLLVALLKNPPQDDQNQDQNQDQQDQQQQQQQQQDQQEQQQQQQPPQPQEQQELSGNAEQILQTMQNRENQTREKTKEEEATTNRRTTDKPW